MLAWSTLYKKRAYTHQKNTQPTKQKKNHKFKQQQKSTPKTKSLTL